MVKEYHDRSPHSEGYHIFSKIDLPKYRIQLPALKRALRDIPAGGIIVDIGCGSCDIASIMSAYTRARMTVCVDRDIDMLKYAKKMHPEPELAIVQAEGGIIPLPDGIADATYANLVLAQQSTEENLRGLVASMAALTKKGGLVVATVSNPKTLHLQPGNAIREFMDGPPCSYEGQPHRYTLLGPAGESLDTFINYYWSNDKYSEAFGDCGLEVIDQHELGFPPSVIRQFNIAQAFDFKQVFVLVGRKVV